MRNYKRKLFLLIFLFVFIFGSFSFSYVSANSIECFSAGTCNNPPDSDAWCTYTNTFTCNCGSDIASCSYNGATTCNAPSDYTDDSCDRAEICSCEPAPPENPTDGECSNPPVSYTCEPP